MKRLFVILLVSIVLLDLLPGPIVKGQDSIFLPTVFQQVSERAALVALYESTDGDNWDHNTNWLSDSVHHCEWYGITCDPEDGGVLQVELRWNHLQGAIPTEFGDLVNLQELDLSYNNLSSLPAEFGNLINLQHLNLHTNSLSSLPVEFGNLTKLQYLNLWGNIVATLPPEIVNLTNLQTLDLSYNSIRCLPETLLSWYHSIPNRSPELFPVCTPVEHRIWPLLAMKIDNGMVPVLAGTSPFLYFDGEEVSGSTGCNAIIGTYTLDTENETVSLVELQQTLVWCEGPPGVMNQEGIYTGLLYDVTGYERNGDALRLLNSENETILLFGELPPVDYLPVACR